MRVQVNLPVNIAGNLPAVGAKRPGNIQPGCPYAQCLRVLPVTNQPYRLPGGAHTNGNFRTKGTSSK